MTRFVSRDGDSKITGHFANLQPGFAEEEVADDNAELLAFINPPKRRRVDRRTIIERLATADLLDEAEAALLAAPTLTRWKWNTALEGVYFDDAETVAFLQSIGADPAVILAP